MDLKFSVRGQSLMALTPATLVSDTIGYLNADFSFSPDWRGLNKWMHLKDESGTVYDVQLDQDRAENLNLTAGRWELWVHGHEITDGVPSLRITTTTVAFKVAQSGALEGEVLPVISTTVAEQVAANAAYAKEMVQSLRADMDGLRKAADDAEASAKASAASAKEAERERLAAENAKNVAEGARKAAEREQTRAAEARRGAEYAQQQAEYAQSSIKNMKVSAETLPENSGATVNSKMAGGVINLHFGIPKGDPGPQGVSGVYVGSDEMPKGYNVKVDPNGNKVIDLVGDIIAEGDKQVARVAAEGATQIRKAEEAASVATHPPVISDNNTWMLWDEEAGSYVDSGKPTVGGELPGTQGDLSVNDASDPAYVKGRTHWSELVIDTILPETTATFAEGMATLPTTLALEVGEEYTVAWNGTEYPCTGQVATGDGEVGVALGNFGAAMGTGDTGEPFAIVAIDPALVASLGAGCLIVCLDDAATAVVRIDGKAEKIHKLDNRYLDLDWLPVVTGTVQLAAEKTVTNDGGTPTDTGGGFADLTASMVYPGMALIVRYDGVDYPCVVHEADDAVNDPDWAGNMGLLDSEMFDYTGEPFLLIFWGNRTVVVGDENPHTASVYTYEYNTLPEAYIPDTIQRAGGDVTLTSPNGTVYKLSVADDGTLTATEVT